MTKVNFYGRKINITTTRGIFDNCPYIVMNTSINGITVMMKRGNVWRVEKACVKLEQIIAKKRSGFHCKYDDIQNMMKHDRAKKTGSSGKSGCSDNMKYKQVTEYAYWANLFDSKSGNASVVCSHIYN